LSNNASPEVLVVGGGLAGCSTALRLADAGVAVRLLLKRDFDESSSWLAQGGVAAAMAADDAPSIHAADTILAGAGLCHRDAVNFVAERAPDCIRWLETQGVRFTHADSGELDLTREGGHTRRRIVHAADASGYAILTALSERVRRHPRIRVLPQQIGIDLLTAAKLGDRSANRCLGLYALDRQTNRVVTHAASAIVLATGGASKTYLYTTNPDTSTGDGIAMAWRSGCRVGNLEFVQFHPTCLYHPYAKGFLISEAVRGEGGRLLLPTGRRFMTDHDPRGELASRDIVARAIDFEMKRGGFDFVLLDISHKPAAEILERFPNIAARCREFGIDITREPIPVVPAAHYTCGGVLTTLEGKTDLPGLYAVGECTFTGLHGANRLASNSLLECAVFGESAAAGLLKELPSLGAPSPALPAWDESRVTDPDEQIVVSHNWEELRRLMWDYVGIVRTNRRLERAQHRLAFLLEEIAEFYGNYRVTNDLIELRNLALVAELTIRCARERRESRGLHYNLDYPQTLPDAEARDTVLRPPGYAGR
jgi:L-aspartate oxidase